MPYTGTKNTTHIVSLKSRDGLKKPKCLQTSRKGKEKILDDSTFTDLMSTSMHFRKPKEFIRNEECICYTKDGWRHQSPACPVHGWSIAEAFEPKSQSVRVEDAKYGFQKRR